LDLASTSHRLLVFGRKFVHAKNGDNVAQLFIALQRLLYTAGNTVVLFTDDLRIKLAAGGVERVDGRVDTQSGDVAGQHNGGVQVLESRGWRGVGQVIGRNVNGLDGRNGTRFGRRNALL